MYQNILSDEYLEHYGIKGQKWGERRFQNEDGSLTAEGRKRYRSSMNPMLSRKIGASYKERTEHGRELVIEKNRTEDSEGWRGAGRGLAIKALATVGGIAVATLATVGSPAVATGAVMAAPILATGVAVANISNRIKTYQNMKDIHTYEHSNPNRDK